MPLLGRLAKISHYFLRNQPDFHRGDPRQLPIQIEDVGWYSICIASSGGFRGNHMDPTRAGDRFDRFGFENRVGWGSTSKRIGGPLSVAVPQATPKAKSDAVT